MSVKTLKSSNLTSTGKYRSIFASTGIAGFGFFEGGDFESIATVTVGSGGSSSITFSDIPATFQHLQVRALYKDSAVVNDVTIAVRANADTGSNYSRHGLIGNGSAASASSGTSQSSAIVGYSLGSSSSTNIFSVSVIDILDYQDTSKNTTFRSFSGADRNGFGEVWILSAAWYNTAAVTSLTILPGQTSFPQHSTFALYGIKAP